MNLNICSFHSGEFVHQRILAGMTIDSSLPLVAWTDFLMPYSPLPPNPSPFPGPPSPYPLPRPIRPSRPIRRRFPALLVTIGQVTHLLSYQLISN